MDIRQMTDADVEPVVRLLTSALGPAPGGVERHELFEWKHLANPAGRSIGLLGVEGEHIMGVRMFLKWRFDQGSDQAVLAARAVDTATDPSATRQGIFSKLTKAGLAAAEAEGVRFIYNTPNQKSAPGYLKMGWSEVAKMPMVLKVHRPARVLAAALARDLRSGAAVPPPTGSSLLPAATFFNDPGVDARIEQSERPSIGIRTSWSPDYLRWRYAQGPIPYHVLPGPDRAAVIVRLRARGRLTEAIVCDVLAGPTAERETTELLRSVPSACGADHAVAHTSALDPMHRSFTRAGFRRVPRAGMVLTAKPVADTGNATSPLEPDNWALGLGDLELF